MSWDSNFTLSTKIPLQLGSIRHFPGTKYKTSFEVAFLQNVRVIDDGWLTEDPNIQDYWYAWVQLSGSSPSSHFSA
jgi:hypothetical protein